MVVSAGQKLGNYRLIRSIGRGGFAEVYLGEHIYLKTPAAIKVLETRLIQDGLENFLKEASTIASLEHPNIVRVLEFGIEDTIPFLVMDYAPHGTLRQLHPKGSKLLTASIVSYVTQVANALQYAHDARVIHLDVKPENMLLGRNYNMILSDFGIALSAHSTNSSSTSGQHDRAGTTAYMAPEQLEGRPARASDQYALGVVTYEWFCGSWPFNGTNRGIAIQHLYTPPPSMQKKVPTIPTEIEQVVMRALAKSPQERFARVLDFAEALKEASIPYVPPTGNDVGTVPHGKSMHTITLNGTAEQHFPETIVTPYVSEPLSSSLPSSPIQPSPGRTRRTPPRRAVIFGLVGIALAGSGILWEVLSQNQQRPGQTSSPATTVAPTTTPVRDATHPSTHPPAPNMTTGQLSTSPTTTATPGATATPSPDPTPQPAPLSVSINNPPSSVYKIDQVNVDVTANRTGVSVTLQVEYDVDPPYSSQPVNTSSNGQATLTWNVHAPHSQSATLTAKAVDPNTGDQVTSYPPAIVQIS
jgi:eukaryotic-like serine/threonine-protein kinase